MAGISRGHTATSDHRDEGYPPVTTKGTTAGAIAAALISPNETDRNFEPANVVDGLFAIARAIDRLAGSVDGHTATIAAIANRDQATS